MSSNLKILIFANFVFFRCKLDDCTQTTNSHQYSSLWQIVWTHRSLLTGTCSYTLCTHPSSKMNHCETEMLLLLPNKQRYHSDDFKKQGETQNFLSAIGCVILKLVGTSCGLGLVQVNHLKAKTVCLFVKYLFNLSHISMIDSLLNSRYILGYVMIKPYLQLKTNVKGDLVLQPNVIPIATFICTRM